MADLPPGEETGLAGLLIGISDFIYHVSLGFGLIIPPVLAVRLLPGGRSGWGWALVAFVTVAILVSLLKLAQEWATDIVERIRNGELFPRLFRVIRHASAAVAMTGFLRLELAFLNGEMTWPKLGVLISTFFRVL